MKDIFMKPDELEKEMQKLEEQAFKEGGILATEFVEKVNSERKKKNLENSNNQKILIRSKN